MSSTKVVEEQHIRNDGEKYYKSIWQRARENEINKKFNAKVESKRKRKEAKASRKKNRCQQ